MAQLRIRTTRHSIKVAAPPQRVYNLVANVDRWPHMFDSVLAVEHIGWSGTGERVRFWGTFGERRGSWVTAREVNPKRMQLRFRQERPAYPFATLGGLWLVRPKGSGAVVALDHYYTVVGDDPVEAQRLEQTIGENSMAMLDALRRAAELGSGDAWLDMQSGTHDRAEGVTSR